MEPLKEALDENFISDLVQDISGFYKKDNKALLKRFKTDVNWKNLELKERIKHCSLVIFEVNDKDFLQTIPFLLEVAPKYWGLQGMVFPTVVEHYGIDHYQESLDTLEWITRFSTGEFAIRPFILQYSQTWDTLYKWTSHKNEHVRRLASEGCRPLLPWGLQLKPLTQDPSPIFPILESLFYDSSEYVRKSVANNLNDISKNQPAQVKAFVQQFDDQHKHQKRIITHGLRTLLKKGDPEAYPIIGYATDVNLDLDLKLRQKTVPSQKSQDLEVKMINQTATKVDLFINMIVYYPRPSGNHLRKVFLLKKCTLKANEQLILKKSISFKDLSTRKHHSGRHFVAIQVNGKEFPKQSFIYQSK